MPINLRFLLHACVAGGALMAASAHAAGLPVARPLVTGAVSDSLTLSLRGDLSQAVALSKDAGALPDATPLPHIRLELKRPAPLQAALDKLVHDQQTKGSADYHRWLTAADLRAYGPAQADIDKVTAWLTAHNLTVNSVARSGMSIDFGGSAADVARAFHTSLHNVTLHGEAHIANVSAPAIPQALAPVVTGVTLHNFFPKPQLQHVAPSFNVAGTSYLAVTPGDFNTIYNVNPLLGSNNGFGQPITGAGITIAVVEQTNIKPIDWQHFRNSFGLGGYAGTFTSVHPGGCQNPGFTGDEAEAAIDAEWASAPAPDAAILEASCATSPPLNFGVETALQGLVENPTPATVLSISYGGAEIFNGYAFTQGWTNLVEMGAAEGKAIFVSAGDSGSAVDRGFIGGDGLGVNALSDSAYVVSVGGTDFLDGSTNTTSQYWGPRNSSTGESALSYIPETPWNNSCAGDVLFQYLGYSNAYSFCNSSSSQGLQNGVGGGGGQSLYATKPSWQSLTLKGMPNDGARDQPDVSLFAANGLWGHFYLICMSDANEGGSPCHYNDTNDVFGNAYGGTSVAAPAFAGIVALIQEVYGPTGNPDPVLYNIAKAQFSTPAGVNPCYSSLGNKISTACAFNIVTAGNNAQPCIAGSTNCVAPPSDAIGVMQQPSVSSGPAFHAHPGYSLATGLGTVNVSNLIYNYLNTP